MSIYELLIRQHLIIIQIKKNYRIVFGPFNGEKQSKITKKKEILLASKDDKTEYNQYIQQQNLRKEKEKQRSKSFYEAKKLKKKRLIENNIIMIDNNNNIEINNINVNDKKIIENELPAKIFVENLENIQLDKTISIAKEFVINKNSIERSLSMNPAAINNCKQLENKNEIDNNIENINIKHIRNIEMLIYNNNNDTNNNQNQNKSLPAEPKFVKKRIRIDTRDRRGRKQIRKKKSSSITNSKQISSIIDKEKSIEII